MGWKRAGWNARVGRRCFLQILAGSGLLGGGARAVLWGEETEVAERVSPFRRRLETVLLPAIERGQFPGCVIQVGNREQVLYEEAWGARQLEPTHEPMTTDTIFDLASLTKPIATATSVMLLVQQEKLLLDSPVAQYWPEFGGEGKAELTPRDLLCHRSGLIADNPLADYRHGPAEALRRIAALKPIAPPRSRMIYSDVNFIVLGELVRRISGRELQTYFQEEIAGPLELQETGFLPDAAFVPRIAPTEQVSGKWLRGEVHDPRAALLGGVAGHAGLFGSARDLGLYSRALLRTLAGQPTGPLTAPTIRSMLAPHEIPTGRTTAAGEPEQVLRGLGWDIRSGFSRNRPETASPESFGHTGFTGTSLWIDPPGDYYVLFLANRLHPLGKGSIHPWAGQVGSLAAKEWG